MEENLSTLQITGSYRTEAAILKDQLFTAVDEDNVEQLKKNLPIDSEVKDKYGSTLLHCAAGKGSKMCLRYLLEVDSESISKKDERGCQPLHNAGYNGQAEIVGFLLANNADILAENEEGQTPLLAACLVGHMETVKLLLSKHHEKNPSELPPTDKAKNTVLHTSVIGNHSMVKELLEFMRSLGYTTDQLQELVDSVNVAGQTILHIAAIRCQLPAIQQCLSELQLSVDNINSVKDKQLKTCEDYAQKYQKNCAIEDQNTLQSKQPGYGKKRLNTPLLEMPHPKRNVSIASNKPVISTLSNITPGTDDVNVLGETVIQPIGKKLMLNKDHKVEVCLFTADEIKELFPDNDSSLGLNNTTDMNKKLHLHLQGGLKGNILNKLPPDCHLVSPIVMVKSETSRPLMMRVTIPHALATISKASNNEVQLYVCTFGVLRALEQKEYELNESTFTLNMPIEKQLILALTIMGRLLTRSRSFLSFNLTYRPPTIKCVYHVVELIDYNNHEINVRVYCGINLPITWKLLSDIDKQPIWREFILSYEHFEISYQCIKNGNGWSVLKSSQQMNALSVLPSPQAEWLSYPPVCEFKVVHGPDAKRVSEKVTCELCIAAGKAKLATQRFHHERLLPYFRSRQSTPVNTKPLLEGLDEGRDEQFEVATYVQSTTANIDTMENNGQDPKQSNLSSKGESLTIRIQAGLEGNSENNPQDNAFSELKMINSYGVFHKNLKNECVKISFNGSKITKEEADMLAAVLLKTVSLEKLDISNASLTVAGAITINSALKNICSLKSFILSGNNINNRAAESIADVLHSNYLIEEIDLSHNKLTSDGLLQVVNILLITENIKIIDISHNLITADGIEDLAIAFSKCSALQKLNISHNVLNLTSVLKFSQHFRYHRSLQSLDLSNTTISFSAASEVIVDIILSVNPKLINLNVCGKNIRPRAVKDCFSSQISGKESKRLKNLHLLQSFSVYKVYNKPIKVNESCPISGEGIDHYYVDYLGGVFCNQYYDFTLVIPPDAVSQGECVEIQATGANFGPYEIPQGCYPISSFLWFSANYTFKVPVYIIMSHYAKIRNLEDISHLHMLQTRESDSITSDKNLLMEVIPEGVYFDYESGYCAMATNHFCSYCEVKGDRSIPEYLVASFCSYEDDDGVVFEVCFCPSTSECKKVIEEQCEMKDTKPDYCFQFDIADGDELFVSSNFPKNIPGWFISQSGRIKISLDDFKYWVIYHNVEQMKEGEKKCLYPPRFKVKCVQTDGSPMPLYSSLDISKKSIKDNVTTTERIGIFPIIRKTTTPIQSPQINGNILPLRLNASMSPPPTEQEPFSLKPDMGILNMIVVPKINAEWEEVAFALRYDIPTVKSIQRNCNNNTIRCCKELFKNWLMTNKGTGPRVWSTLLDAFKKVGELESAREDIIKELVEMYA